MAVDRIIIIGASAAGVSAAREIRNNDPSVQVMMFSDETCIPYYRPYLTEFIENKKVKEKSNFFIISDEWFRSNNVTLRLNEKVVRIDPHKKEVFTKDGDVVQYSKLIISTGSTPFVPDRSVLEKENVFAIRTFDDAEKVHDYSLRVKRAVVIGGGLLGLEAAYVLMKKGIHVSVVEMSGRILPNQLDQEGSAFFEKIIKRNAVETILGECVEAMIGEGPVKGVRLSSGRVIDTDMVVYSIGVRSNVLIAKECGLQVNKAIVVNERMETSIRDIYACGDVAEYKGRTVALWMNAVRQGRVAGSNAAGVESSIGDEIFPAVLNSFGTRLYSAGEVCNTAVKENIREQREINDEKGIYKKVFFKDDVMAGFILIGDISDSQKLLKGIKSGMTHKDYISVQRGAEQGSLP